jgi:HAD superfamily hydrolase (TIGR01548 family)
MAYAGELKLMMRNRRLLPLDSLIFDMDGVLVDVSQSYREVIRRTVHLYLSDCLGWKLGRTSPVTQGNISLFKSTGGFNNDWELTSAILLWLISGSPIPPLSRVRNFPSLPAAVSYLREAALRSTGHRRHSRQQINLSRFLGEVQLEGGGLRGVRRALRRTRNGSWDGWVYGQGFLDRKNIVQRIFQEVYLGTQFKRCYRLDPLFYRGPGYYLRETLLVPGEMLKSLHKKYRLGIATGRPRFEAGLALKRFQIGAFFDTMVTLDECQAEERRILETSRRRVRRTKPHPYALLRAIQEMGLSSRRCGYVGDTVDDMRAARSAGRSSDITAIGFLRDRRTRDLQKTSFLEAGAKCMIERPEDLLRL